MSLFRLTFLGLPLFLCGALFAQGKNEGVLLKDLARIQGVRSNQLMGYGIVVGLAGTGDSKSKLAEQSIANLLGGLGQRIQSGNLQARNIAAVIVTTEIPAFAAKGDRLTAVVSSIGDAKSIEGGVLIQTPMVGGDGATYSVAQGVVTTGGGARNKTQSKTVGTILNGALVEKDITSTYVYEFEEKNEKGEKTDKKIRKIRITLNEFDFETLQSVKDKIEKDVAGSLPALDGNSIWCVIPEKKDPVTFVSEIERLRVQPHLKARIVINERTGAIVMGGDIKIEPVAVSRGGMDLIVTGRDQPGVFVSQPAEKDKKVLVPFSGASVSEIIEAMNTMGAGVRDIIAILEALKESGALHAELIVQ